ncbi:MAG: GntR family transcriptional regulator [Hominimerdicola sp.]
MDFNSTNEKPIYIQLADWLADMIIEGAVKEGEQIPSTTEISVAYKVNPATALKGINILVDKSVIFKKRGVGMFVSDGAVKILKKERKNDFQKTFVKAMVDEAKKLGIDKKEILSMIERSFDE